MGGTGISPREAEILQAVGRRLTNAEIAAQFYLSPRTVESHVSALLRKLGAANRTELAALAARHEPVASTAELVGLPAAWTSFVGRAGEQRDLRAALAGDRLVTLVGPGGAGKTRLAAVVATDVAGSLERGGAWVDLVPVHAETLLAAAAAVVGVGDEPDRPLLATIRQQLAGGRYLLVLDNCEHLTGEVAPVVAELLAGCPELTVLCTSRERLGLPGERVLRVPALSLLPALPSGDSWDADAMALFAERARSAGIDVTDTPDAVAEICRRLDGLPLAIELAAARAAAIGTGGLLAATADGLDVLTARPADSRHGSLRAVLDWSNGLLGDDERMFFWRLGIFAGTFDLHAAATVGDVPAAADLVGRLVDKSLVIHVRMPAGDRWRLLETIRQYARDALARSGDLAATTARHDAWATGTAAALAERLDETGWAADFDLVADDLRAAAATGRDHALTRDLAALLYARRLVREAERWYREAAQCAPRPADAVADLRCAAEVAMADIRGDDAFALFRAAAEVASQVGDHAGHATCLARAVTLAARFPSTMREDVPFEQLIALREEAARTLPPGDSSAAAHVAIATAWTSAARTLDTDEAAAHTALQRAHYADDPALISAALDAVAVAPALGGRVHDGYHATLQRLDMLPRLRRTDPASAMEVSDTTNAMNLFGVSSGNLRHALDVVRRLQHDPVLDGSGFNGASKPITLLVLSGHFDEALAAAELAWTDWTSKGRPAARWMSLAIAAIALVHGLRGDTTAHAEWAERTFDVAGTDDLSAHPELPRSSTSPNRDWPSTSATSTLRSSAADTSSTANPTGTPRTAVGSTTLTDGPSPPRSPSSPDSPTPNNAWRQRRRSASRTAGPPPASPEHERGSPAPPTCSPNPSSSGRPSAPGSNAPRPCCSYPAAPTKARPTCTHSAASRPPTTSTPEVVKECRTGHRKPGLMRCAGHAEYNALPIRPCGRRSAPESAIARGPVRAQKLHGQASGTLTRVMGDLARPDSGS